MSRLVRSVATLLLLAGLASAGCPVLSAAGNQQVPLNQLKAIVLNINQVFNGKNQPYVWSLDLCNGNAATPTGSGKPCANAGFVEEFSAGLSCEQTFTTLSTQWSWNGTAANAVFSASNGYTMNVGVVCGDSTDLVALWPVYASQSGSGLVSWGMQLSAKGACPRAAPATPTPPTPLPPGWTFAPYEWHIDIEAPAACDGGCAFVIIVFVGLFVYAVVAVLWNYFRLGKRGRELAPHPAFWTSLPGLVKDGFIFTFTKLRGLCQRGGGSSAGGYSQV